MITMITLMIITIVLMLVKIIRIRINEIIRILIPIQCNLVKRDLANRDSSIIGTLLRKPFHVM